MSDTSESVREFVRAQGQVSADDKLFNDDVDLFDYGYLDSFGIVGLIELVEQRYGVDLSSVDFYAGDGRTIRGIARTIDARIGG
jgi:acyl carrier protein